MNRWNLVAFPLGLVFLVNFQSNSLADTFSKPGIGVTITLPNGLFSKPVSGNISGTYQSQGTEGILFDAPQVGSATLGESDTAYFNFVDTKGPEKCYGSASISSGGVSTWEIKGAVPSYHCSTIGKSYRFNFGR
jgi:hypothetical protein